MASPSDHERNRIPPRPSDSTFPVQNEENNNIISQPLREEPSNSILGPISLQKLSLLNNQKHINLEHNKLPSLAKPVGFVNDKMVSTSNTNLNQRPLNNQNVLNYNTDNQAKGIPVTMPPQQLTSFSVPTTNQFLRNTNEQTMKWDEVTSKKVETSANNQIKNIIMNAGGNVHTSFWDSLIEKTTNKSGSSSNPVIKISLDSNMLKSPLLNTQTTTNNNNVPNVEEEVEAEDTTTTTTTTTTMKPNEEFRMEIHTNQDGVSKISIIPQSNPSESKASTTCSPSSEDFNCFGKSPFDSVKSIGTWCLAKCLQGSCIETVCSCSCDKKQHSSSYHSQVENMASALSTGKNTDSGQIQSTLNEIYSSLRETAQSSSNTNNVQASINGNHQNNQNNQNVNSHNNNNNNPNSNTGDSMNVQFLLRSIEGMIENKLRMMAPRTTPKPEEEVEAEDLQKTPTPSNNWNNNENNNGNNMNNNWNNNGNNNNGNDGNNNANNNWNNNNANNNWNNNGNNNNNNNNWNNNGNNGNNWNNNNNHNGNWNNNQNSNWNNNGNSNGNNWNNNGNNNWNNNWQNGNNWQNNSPGPWQNGNWNNGPNNSGWNGPPPNWTQGPWNNGGGGGSWGGANNQWNNWGGSGNWNMAFSRRNPWQNNGGGEGGEAAD